MKLSLAPLAFACALTMAAPAQATVILPNLFAVRWCDAAQAGANLDQAMKYAVQEAIGPGEPTVLSDGRYLESLLAVKAIYALCPSDALRAFGGH